MTAGISIVGLNKSFDGVNVLREINLEVAPGEFTVLLGPSGCGKSTLLAAIAGLDPVDDGAVVIGKEEVTHVPPDRRGIAMVFQSYALFPTMTVRRNLSFGLQMARVPREEIETRVKWASEILQLEPYLDRKPGQLSGGQRQRVAIGRALVRHAKVFLFDEPLSNLDAKLRTETRMEIKRLHQMLGSTIVYVTHDQVEAMTLATRIAVMKDGRIEQYDAPEVLYERPATLFVAGFVGSPAMNLLDGELVVEAGAPKVRIGNTVVDVAGYAFAGPVAPQTVVLGLRPENVALAEGDDPGAVPGAFTLAEPMGADTFTWFSVEGQKVSARLHPSVARTLGGTHGLRFDARGISLFSRETGKRL